MVSLSHREPRVSATAHLEPAILGQGNFHGERSVDFSLRTASVSDRPNQSLLELRLGRSLTLAVRNAYGETMLPELL